MTYDPRKVVSYGFPLDDFTFTYNLAAGIGQANLGNALTLDTSAASKMKLAGNGAAIHGRLFQAEDRSQQGAGLTGSVQRKFKEILPCIAASGLAVGDSVCGSATPGTVRKAVAGTDPITNLVVEVLTNNRVVVESL